MSALPARAANWIEALSSVSADPTWISMGGSPRRSHVYQAEDITDSWRVNAQLNEIFPEARHCSGCDRSCPKDIEVQRGVNLAAAGDIRVASDLFVNCIMCSLCRLACPEYIRPNHVGLSARRAVAALSLRPSDLIARLEQIESGAMQVDADAPDERSHADGWGPL